jgi:hypothetical protein
LCLIGITQLGTTYEICFWPTFIYQWVKIVDSNSSMDNVAKDKLLQHFVSLHDELDKNVVLR